MKKLVFASLIYIGLIGVTEAAELTAYNCDTINNKSTAWVEGSFSEMLSNVKVIVTISNSADTASKCYSETTIYPSNTDYKCNPTTGFSITSGDLLKIQTTNGTINRTITCPAES